MEKIEIQQLLNFSELIYAFERVARMDVVPGTDRHENDAEHSYHLAMLAWYISDVYKLDLDTEKLLKYALTHDLVEAYAGDTPAYGGNQSLVTKHDREASAQMQIQKEFPDFYELNSSIDMYEKRNDPESAFIYALDKIIPILVCYAGKGKAWKKWDVTFEKVCDVKRSKVGDHDLRLVLEDILSIVEKERVTLFN